MPDITIQGGDGEFSAYLAVPAGGSGPGIIAIQKIFGVNTDMRAHCDGFAAQGYVALSPDLFWRQEPGIQITDRTDAKWQQAFKLYQGFDADKGVDKDAQARIKQGLAGNDHVTIHSYAGVNHAFTRNNGINYDAAAAKLAHGRTAAAFAAALR